MLLNKTWQGDRGFSHVGGIDLGHQRECDKSRHDLCGTFVLWGKQFEFKSNMNKTESNKFELEFEFQTIIIIQYLR